MIRIIVKFHCRKSGQCELIFQGIGKRKNRYYCFQLIDRDNGKERGQFLSATSGEWHEADCHIKEGVRFYIADTKTRKIISVYEQHRKNDFYWAELIRGKEIRPGRDNAEELFGNIVEWYSR